MHRWSRRQAIATGLLPAVGLLLAITACGGSGDAAPRGVKGLGPDGGLSFTDPTTIGVGESLANVDPTVDSDRDGVLDVIEGSADGNGNGQPAHLDPTEHPGARPTAKPVPRPTLDGGLGAADASTPGCGVVRAESQFERAPVDVIWAIDNSPSMITSVLAVSAGLDAFATRIEGTGADIHVAMLSLFTATLDPAVQQDTDRYLLLPVDVTSTNAFRVLLSAYPQYADFLRPTAATHFIVVSDFSSDSPRAAFRTQMRNELGHDFYFHAIADPLLSVEYYELATETGGEQQPIGGDWNLIFDRLEAAVKQTAALPCQIPVPVIDDRGRDLNNVQVLYTPTGGSQRPFPKADGPEQCADALAWHYDDNDSPMEIRLCPVACQSVQNDAGALEVVFACEPPPPLL